MGVYRDEMEVLRLKDQLEKLGAAHDRLLEERNALLAHHQEDMDTIQELLRKNSPQRLHPETRFSLGAILFLSQ